MVGYQLDDGFPNLYMENGWKITKIPFPSTLNGFFWGVSIGMTPSKKSSSNVGPKIQSKSIWNFPRPMLRGFREGG